MVGQFSYVLADYMGDPSPVNSRFVGNVFYAPKGDKTYPLPPHNSVSAGDKQQSLSPRNLSTAADSMHPESNGSEFHLDYPIWMKTSDGKAAGIDESMLASTHAAESGLKTPLRSEVSAPAPKR